MGAARGVTGKLKDIGFRGWMLLALCAAAAVALLGALDMKTGADAPSALEARLEQVLSRVEGAGNVSVIVYQSAGEATGVLVVAEGAGDMRVKLTLQSAIKTLMGIDNANIEIVKMEGASDEAG